jgi:hypothetical protein
MVGVVTAGGALLGNVLGSVVSLLWAVVEPGLSAAVGALLGFGLGWYWCGTVGLRWMTEEALDHGKKPHSSESRRYRRAEHLNASVKRPHAEAARKG